MPEAPLGPGGIIRYECLNGIDMAMTRDPHEKIRMVVQLGKQALQVDGILHTGRIGGIIEPIHVVITSGDSGGGMTPIGTWHAMIMS